jgi:AsmA-like protein
MENNYNSPKSLWQTFRTSAYTKWFLRIVGIFAILVVLAYLLMAYYINNNKKEVLASLTSSLNENLNGSLTVGSMEPAFLEGFPLLSLNLKNVVITDSLYGQHKQALLRADNFDISVNALALLRGAVEIRKVAISDAAMTIYTDSSGYSNTSVFRKDPKAAKSEGGGYPEIRKFTLDNVAIAIDNKSKCKLFKFNVRHLKGGINYIPEGWKADIDLNTHVNSMAFNTRKGSFAKGKDVIGDLKVTFNRGKEFLVILPSNLQIGDEDFIVSANFELGKTASKFNIDIKNNKIMWRKASNLLAGNISDKLDMYDIKDPIKVTCHIAGDFNVEGDPLILVNATIRNNTIDTPGGRVANCSFDGQFTNLNMAGKGYNDANSAVKFNNFEGDYAGIPIRMKKAAILNLEQPIATGEFTATFDVDKLNNLIDPGVVAFTKGTASVALSYTADIVNFELAKPIVAGTVNIKNADVKYSPRNLQFKDISVALNFKDEDLYISNIHLRSGKSVVDMQGQIRNFLNLYYTAPETMVLKWNVTSRQLHLKEFLGFLGARKSGAPKPTGKKGNFTQEINTLFEKSKVNMNLKVDKLYYGNFYASDVVADLFVNDVGITLKNGALKHAGGTMKLNGTLLQKPNGSRYDIDALVLSVDVSRFFAAFDSFGLESLQPENLKGFVSVKTRFTGMVSNEGALVPNSINGDVLFSLRKAALVNFAPVKSVGKYAFAFRDLNTISIESLDGKFDIRGEKVEIHPMKINSSVLNMDMQGIYSFGRGTEIYLSVPLRDPERDKGIIDAEQLAKRRTRGVVINLVAKDDKDGKVKIGLGKKEKE